SLLFGHLPTNLLLDEAELPPQPPPVGPCDSLQQELWAEVALDLFAAEAAQAAAPPGLPGLLRRGAARWTPPPSDALTGCGESAPILSVLNRGDGLLLHQPHSPMAAPVVKSEAAAVLGFELAAWADAAGGAVAEVPPLQLHGDDLSGLFAPGGGGSVEGAEAAEAVASVAALLRCDEGMVGGNEWDVEAAVSAAVAVAEVEEVEGGGDGNSGGGDGGCVAAGGMATGARGNEKNPRLVWHGCHWAAKNCGRNAGGASGSGCDGERAAGKRTGGRRGERGRLRGMAAAPGCSARGAKSAAFAGRNAGEASRVGSGTSIPCAGGVELSCEECGRVFTRPDTLAVHRFKHLPYASRPFACQDW
ncbi:hypothetical protein HK405_012899, partial [Cladochytrium tenue]